MRQETSETPMGRAGGETGAAACKNSRSHRGHRFLDT